LIKIILIQDKGSRKNKLAILSVEAPGWQGAWPEAVMHGWISFFVLVSKEVKNIRIQRPLR
jgi:hypothetical protein